MRTWMRTKVRFDETLNRCDTLVGLFSTQKNDDLLRAAIVLAVAALDKCCKDKFLDFFEQFYRRALSEHQNRECCDAYLDKANIKGSDRLTLYQEKAVNVEFNPEREIADRLRSYLYRSTFQRIESITELFSCYGLNNIIEHAVNKTGRPRVWKSVESLILRRHQITHTADYGTGDEVCGVDRDEVVTWLESLDELVECIDFIVNNKFRAGLELAIETNTVGLLSGLKGADFTATHHKLRGWLDVKERSALRRIADIEDLFGVKVKRRGFLCAGAVDYPGLVNAEIWWPKIASEPNYAGWLNKAQYDSEGEIIGIVEENVINRDLNGKVVDCNISKNRLRIVLAVVEGDNCVVGYCYRFLGTFKLDKVASEKRRACIWQRQDTRIVLKASLP